MTIVSVLDQWYLAVIALVRDQVLIIMPCIVRWPTSLLQEIARAERSVHHAIGDLIRIAVLLLIFGRWTVIAISMQESRLIWLPISVDIRDVVTLSTLCLCTIGLLNAPRGQLHVLLLLNLYLHQWVLMVFVEITRTECHLGLSEDSLLSRWTTNLVILYEEIPMLVLPMPIVDLLLQALDWWLLLVSPFADGH